MTNKYKIQQIIDNGTYIKMPFIYSTAATPTFSAITVTNDIISSGQFIGDGSQITNLESNSGITGNFVNKTGDTMSGGLVINSTLVITGSTTVTGDIIPQNDDETKLGTGLKRFRELNAYSGNTTIWSSTVKITTPSLELGVDSSGNTRTITANNSIIKDDTLLGGTF
jgi:hypothetical protein